MLRMPPKLFLCLLLSMVLGQVTISYDYYLNLSRDDGFDRMIVEISSNSIDGPWIEIARHRDDMGTAWTNNVITQADLEDAGVALT
ncbi:MAG: hypothetical protein O6929_04285, partial [candidate division NC10 bacterium]|nr:hypothetical protein [candidate division NC10 bacterium]